MTKRDFLLALPHHLEQKYLQEYYGTMISADYNESVPGGLVIRAKLNNGYVISKVLVVPDYNIQKVKNFINKLNNLEEQDKDYLVALFKHSEYIWYVELKWFRNNYKIIDDIGIYISLDREYDKTKKEDREILEQKQKEYSDKYIRDAKEHFDPLPIEMAECEKAVTKFIFKYFNILVDTDDKIKSPPTLIKKEPDEVANIKSNISLREHEIIKRVYEEWLKSNTTKINAEEMKGLKCFLRFCDINLNKVRSENVD